MPQPSDKFRWLMLATGSLIMFGNYYAFDNPASLNQPLQEYMGMSDETYAYFLNILYTSYSLPNIVLPWLGGYASDKFGLRRLLLFTSATVALGHFVVCLGLERRSVPAMILGRVLFGAGESLAVAQSSLTVKYFRGKELAMALGINLCVGRLGSVLNDIVTPYIWSKSSVPTAFWGGFVSCVMSFMVACLLVWMDSHFESTTAAGFSRLPVHPGESRFSLDTLRSATNRDVLESESGSGSGFDRYDPPSSAKLQKSFPEEEIDLEVFHDTERTITTNEESSVVAQAQQRIDGANGMDRMHPQSTDMEHYELHSADVDREDIEPMVSRNQRKSSDSPFAQCLDLLLLVRDYSWSFWVLIFMTFLLIGVQVPFNSIHAGFLQMRWYHDDPKKAAQIMTVPDILSAVLVLPVGYFVDHYGQKSWLFLLCALIISLSHCVLAVAPISSPVPALMALGVASAIGAIFNSVIPALVRRDQIATAYGILSSSMNAAFSLFPLIVARLLVIDPSYTYAELFFSACGAMGFIMAIKLRSLDRHGDLDRKEIGNVDS
ncbi:hypothetical protein BG011_007318 [Mortierella polycephala]|uniref:Lysosomal dipeptide transporter MFSD1 n=1 Tax=Mortierella polycephala TaxID=41804 RepID=A0A9P6U8K1_9FUNG|nr:hypothetical protein BG011_007318 [Mortierella polycephala]